MNFGVSSHKVRFLDVYGFGIHVYHKKGLWIFIVIILWRMCIVVTSLLIDKDVTILASLALCIFIVSVQLFH
jgi:hypothetical protein